ncbi:UNVERIFIED_CONTAM: hypothetical protein Scaly_2737800 [Sesamum calycinum]|uniref:Reverse transcriptase domain-containing protein n=1 Tax=Sesamum calycinum TaxID=2727403 RepID=A0AAW2J2I2_9LAMI
MFVDGSSTSSRSGVDMVIKSLEADYMEYVITLEFPASNNEAEYEAILLGSRLIHAAGARKETPFNLVYGTEAVLPTEIGEETWKVRSYDSTINSESRREDLDLMEEKREIAERRICIYKSKMARAYDDRVRPPSSRKEI